MLERARRDLSGVRHAQRAQPGVRAGCARRPATSRCSACTAWARRCITVLRLPGARLRAGRHARGPARLSGAPAAGERRQHQLRASPGRSVGAGGGDRRRPGTASAARSVPVAIRGFRCRAISIRTAQFRRPRSCRSCDCTSACCVAIRASRLRDAPTGGAREIRNPADRRMLVGSDRRCRRRRKSTRNCSVLVARLARLGRGRRRASRARCWNAPPT